MATTTYPIRVESVSELSEFGLEAIRDGLKNTVGEMKWPGLDELYDKHFEQFPDGPEHPATFAWERAVIDAAADEVAGEAARLFTDAIRRRLPWTWSPSDDGRHDDE